MIMGTDNWTRAAEQTDGRMERDLKDGKRMALQPKSLAVPPHNKKETAPGPVQGKVLTERCQEKKVKCAYTRGRTHARRHAASRPRSQHPGTPPCKHAAHAHAAHTHAAAHSHAHQPFLTPPAPPRIHPLKIQGGVLLFFTHILHLQGRTAVLTRICEISDKHHTTTSNPPSLFHRSYQHANIYVQHSK